MNYEMISHIAKNIKKITEIPTDIDDLDKKLLFLESNQQFIDKININDWFAHCIYYNKINMIAMLNNFIREYDIIIEPHIIYRTMVSIEIKDDIKKMEKYYGNVCINYNIKSMLSNMMDKYLNLFDKKRYFI